MEHNKEMVIVHYLTFNEVWENPLVIWSILIVLIVTVSRIQGEQKREQFSV